MTLDEDNKKQFKKLFDDAKNVGLSDQEKSAMRFQIADFVKQNPMGQPYSLRKRFNALFNDFLTTLNRKPVLMYGLSALLIFVSLGSGVSSAANQALPGDLLYPVKVGVNEKVLGFVQFSDEAKAEYNVELAELRLKELEKKVATGTLNDATQTKIVALLNEHIQKAQEQSDGAKKKSQMQSLRINADLEASLKAHKKILNRLSEGKKTAAGQTSAGLLPNFTDAIDSIKKSQYDDEEELSKQVPQALQLDSENKMKEAKQKIAEVTKVVEHQKGSLGEVSYSTAWGNVKIATDVFAEGNAAMQAKEYSKAFSLFQKSMGLAEETQISIEASLRLHIELPSLTDEGSHDNDNEGDGSI